MPPTEPPFDVAPREEPLPSVIRATIDAYRQKAERKDVTFGSDVEETIVEIDAFWFDKAVRGMLRHAVDSTPPDGAVTIAARVQGDHLVVSVRDTGHGFDPSAASPAPEDLELHKPGADPDDDQGPGLDVVRLVAEGHGGRLWVESTGRGEGKTLHMAVPAVCDETAAIRSSARPDDSKEA